MPEYIEVSQEQFDAFVRDYPHELHKHHDTIFEPAVLSYNDFRDGKRWPESVVAWVRLNEDMAGHPSYQGKKNAYYLREDLHR